MLRHGQLVACGSYPEVAALQLPELFGGAVTVSLDVPAEQQQQQQEQKQDVPQQEQQQQQLESLPEQQQAPAATLAAVAAAGASSQVASQQEPVASPAGGGSSSSIGSSDETDPEFEAERMLSRIRTMAPDINRRPADSGRLPPNASTGSMLAAAAAGSGTSSSRWWGSSGVSFVHAASRVRMWGSGFFQGQQQQQQQLPESHGDAADVSPCAVSSSKSSSSGLWVRIHHAVAGLFTPPAYLPGGAYYIPPPASTLELPTPQPSTTGFRAPSLKGLLALGPVRSVLQQPSLRYSNSSKWMPTADEAGAVSAAAGKPANGSTAAATAVSTVPAEKGTGGAAGAAPVGQLVAAEAREIGSVSWSVYGQYCKQIGLLTTVLLTAALFAGQALALAAEWWLALWAASPPSQQQQVRCVLFTQGQSMGGSNGDLLVEIDCVYIWLCSQFGDRRDHVEREACIAVVERGTFFRFFQAACLGRGVWALCQGRMYVPRNGAAREVDHTHVLLLPAVPAGGWRYMAASQPASSWWPC